MDYHKVRDSLNTGDILLFRAGTSTAGRVVGVISGSPFSHVAMVVRYPTADGQEVLCMWEAGRDDITDVIEHRKLAGVHLINLDDILGAYTSVWEGDFVLRRLDPPLNDAQREELIGRLKALSGTPFPSLLEIALDQLESRFNPTRFNRRTYACAELIAETFQRISLLSISRPSESYAAADFALAGNLPFQFGHKLGPEELLIFAEGDPTEKRATFRNAPSTGRPISRVTSASILLPDTPE